ncbi:hypothetical protein [Marinobacter sp.]|uniref:hypothetical protein n=1 Tax=Gammaproteobacteria TaxID=1236 RepID=UPI003A8EDF6D
MSDFARSVTIDISDSSAGDLIVNYATLTGGQWKQQPQAGSVINPGNQVEYVNGVPDAYSKLGGKIALTPASGGLIEIEWDWPFGSGSSGTVKGNSLNGLSVSSQWINQQSTTPTFQVTVSNANTAQLIRKNAAATA